MGLTPWKVLLGLHCKAFFILQKSLDCIALGSHWKTGNIYKNEKHTLVWIVLILEMEYYQFSSVLFFFL